MNFHQKLKNKINWWIKNNLVATTKTMRLCTKFLDFRVRNMGLRVNTQSEFLLIGPFMLLCNVLPSKVFEIESMLDRKKVDILRPG